MSTQMPSGLSPDPCIAAGQIRSAIFLLASGQSVQEVREKESWLKWMTGGAASLPALRRLLYECECACDPTYRHGRAIRVGPVVNPWFAAPYERVGFYR